MEATISSSVRARSIARVSTGIDRVECTGADKTIEHNKPYGLRRHPRVRAAVVSRMHGVFEEVRGPPDQHVRLWRTAFRPLRLEGLGHPGSRVATGLVAHGAQLLQIDEDITDAGRIVNELATETETFSVATLREPYRVEGKKTMLLEIWEALGGMPDWILFPTGGGTGVAGMWKALQELRELGWYEGPWPRFGVVQAEGCAPLVKAWKDGRETAELWPNPRTDAAGLRVPGTLADRIVLRALRETRGAAVAVTEAAMKVASQNLAVLEGISACLEGAATLAGLRRLYDEGTITRDDRVVLVNTGAADNATVPRSSVPTIRTTSDARSYLGLTPRAP